MIRGAASVVMLAVVAAVAIAGPAKSPARLGAVVQVEHQTFEDAPAVGPADALVTVELFFVPGLTDSHSAYRELLALQRRHPGQLRAVFRPMDRSAHVLVPALAVAAHARGKFFAFMDQLGRPDVVPSSQIALELAAALGIDPGRVSRDAIDDTTMAALRANRYRYFRIEATSLPAMLFNGRLTMALYDRLVTATELDDEYRAALSAARYALDHGVPRRALATVRRRYAPCSELDADADAAPPQLGSDEISPLLDAPSVHWRLGPQTRRGTGCPPMTHIGGRLDERDPPTDVRSGYLLASGLPIADMPTIGPPDAPVMVHVLCNLRGSACAEQLGRARRLAEYFSGDARVVYSPWLDLTAESSAADLALAETVLCATRGDGWAVIRVATSGLLAPSRKPSELAELAHLAGLDGEDFARCAQRPGAPRTRAALQAAREAGIGWGPTVVIGGRAYVGGFSDDRPMAEVIEAELAPGLLDELAPSY